MITDMIRENVSLQKYNTFGIDVTASFFCEFTSTDELSSILSDPDFRNVPVLILGGGSNILFTKNFEGLVLKNSIPGIQLLEQRDHSFLVKAGAGVVWHQLVDWCIGKNYRGIENLSLIPGCAGAAPIQNIGAYGVELKDVFYSLEAFEINTGNLLEYNKRDCEFGYRDSIFKRHMKGKVVITGVTLELSDNADLNLSYGAIEQELKKMGVDHPGVKAVSDAVCNIRRSKLPDPVLIGNAGSFFKNPEVDASVFDSLKSDFPSMVGYPSLHGKIKIAAGWLIEQCGWKGKVEGNTGSHKDQALVLVNYGGATGNEILSLAMSIKESVKNKFGVDIEPEVNVI